jgi:hypothetical protein
MDADTSSVMARLLALTVVLATCTVPLAQAGQRVGDGTLSVKRGRGQIVLKLKGTVIGRVATNGRVQIRDLKPFDGNDPQLTCKPRARHISYDTTLCTGKNIGFRVNDGRFNVTVRGNGVSISAVGKGPVTVDGTGETGIDDGVMSLDNGPYQSLPDTFTKYYLGTPPTTAR